MSKTVEDYLQDVSYDFTGYKPSKEALEFVSFIQAVNDGVEENETPVVHLKLMDSVFNKEEMCAIMVARGMGKALSLDSKVYTPEGVTTMREVQVGDKVLDRNGYPTTVVSKSVIHNKPMYLMSLGDGREVKVCEDHNHIVKYRRRKSIKGKIVNYLDEKVMTTKELVEDGVVWNRGVTAKQPKGVEAKYWVPMVTGAVIHTKQEVLLDPYTVGLILGDTKSIPDVYKYNDVDTRLSVLRGLMDTDGTVDTNGNTSFTSVSKQLAEDVTEIVRGLGGVANLRYKESTNSYNVYIRINHRPFNLKRKQDRWKANRPTKIAITSIVRIADEPSQCITVASSTESFLTEGYTVTHNTTLFAEYLILYIAAFGKFPGFGNVDFILYVTDSIENGVRNLRRNIEFRYNNSSFLQELIPDQRIQLIDGRDVSYNLEEQEEAIKAGVRFTDVRLELRNYKGDVLVVRGYGVSTGLRGAKEMGKRPTLAILDDLLSDDDARSPTVISNVNDIIYKSVDKALHPTNRKIIYLGTPFNANDPLYQAIESGVWNASVFPICERFPVDREEFIGAWEDRFTYKSIEKSHRVATNVGRVSAFYQEMMLQIHSEEDLLINPKTIRKVKYDDIMDEGEGGHYYITTDFATSEKESADFSAMTVWLHTVNDHLYIIDGYCKKSRMQKNIDSLFDFVVKYKPVLVGIEVSGQQGGFIDWIQSEMRRRGEYFVLAKDKRSNSLGIRPTKNKILRLESLVSMFNRGQISINEEVVGTTYGKELYEELSLASPRGYVSKHDDAGDSLSQLIDIGIYCPSTEIGEETVLLKDFYDRLFDEDEIIDEEVGSYII